MNPQNILLIGSGGREHTLAWKINQSSLCKQLFITPGNGGTTQYGTNLNIESIEFSEIKKAALKYAIDLIIVGPEEPLVKGITDFFKNDPATAHINVFGPHKEAAQLEGSKAFAIEFMNRHGIPTASHREFTKENYQEGIIYLKQQALPIVIKADGLAAGKGVLICNSYLEALAEFELIIMGEKFGAAGKRVVIEQFLKGIEMSVFIITNGKDYVMLPEAKDYKRVGEKDKGLNTGGMGAISPVPFFNKSLLEKVDQLIIKPTVLGLKKDKYEYFGFLFFGLMICGGEPFVIEYNCRLGDPETEVILPRLQNDLVKLINSAFDGNLANEIISTDSRCAATVVAVSGGYPGIYKTDYEIFGFEKLPADSLIFHAGTKMVNGQLFTNGGRVMASTSLGNNLKNTVEQCVNNLDEIFFEDMYFRSDIGYEFTN